MSYEEKVWTLKLAFETTKKPFRPKKKTNSDSSKKCSKLSKSLSSPQKPVLTLKNKLSMSFLDSNKNIKTLKNRFKIMQGLSGLKKKFGP